MERLEEATLQNSAVEMEHLQDADALISDSEKLLDHESITSEEEFIIQHRLPNQRSVFLEPVTHSLFEFPTYMESELNAAGPDILRDMRRGISLPEALAEQNLLQHATMLDRLPCHMSNCSCLDELSTKLEESKKEQDSVMDASAEEDHGTDIQHPLSAVPENTDLISGHDCPNDPQGKTSCGKRHAHQSKCLKRKYILAHRNDIFYRGSLSKEGLIQSYTTIGSVPLSNDGRGQAVQSVVKVIQILTIV